MSEFIFVYRFPENCIGSPEAASLWESWFDALATSLFDKGNPVFVTAATGDTGQVTGLGGYSLITAENIDAAVELAKNCPIVTSGGGVEVGELTAVPGRHHPARSFELPQAVAPTCASIMPSPLSELKQPSRHGTHNHPEKSHRHD